MNSLKKGIFFVFIANVINMVISILTNFLLPKYLSVETYSYIKTYQLYIGMIGIMHLGYVDGMFLKYGGKEIKHLEMKDLNLNVSTFRIFQTIVTIAALVLAFFINNEYVYIIVSLSILPLNMSAYFKSLYQSIGEFERYSRLMNATTTTTLLANLILLFGFKVNRYQIYLTVYLIINLVIWGVLEKYFVKSCRYRFKIIIFSFKELAVNIREGILLMLGNFVNSLLTSMDRWFVKALLNTVAFAQYSFACSMETMINVAVTPITVTLYNYFCKNPTKENVIKVRNSLIVIATGLISCAFPAKFILEIYLVEYIESTNVLFCLFGAQIFFVVIKSVYVNLYKAFRQQRKYFIKLVSIIIIGFALNVLCFQILHTKEAFAIGTLISAFIWFIFSVNDFRQYTLKVKQMVYMGICLVTFLICGYTMEAIFGFIVYVAIALFMTLLLMRKELIYILSYIKGLLPQSIINRMRKIFLRN